MATRNIDRRSGTGLMRNTPNSVAIEYDTASSQPKILDADGTTIRALVAEQAPSITTAATLTITAAMDGRTLIDNQGASTTTYTLPLAATTPGMKVTFICLSAAGEILVNPNAADQISIKGLVDHSTSVKPAAGTGIKNTAATNVIGDHLTLRSDGVNTWHEVAGAGIWASQ